MIDPYILLGVSRNSTDDQIKAAYRELAKKYHPDANNFNEQSKINAEQKMQEINEAYDRIFNERHGGDNANSGYGNVNTEFYDIRSLIAQGKYDQAQTILEGVPQSRRTAEWYFLNGSVMYRKGWFDNAYNNFSTACQMDPHNSEYAAALKQMNNKQTGSPYRAAREGNSGCGCSACDICSGLICADCCCECMGGDLITCC